VFKDSQIKTETDIQTHRQTYKHTDKHTHRHKNRLGLSNPYSVVGDTQIQAKIRDRETHKHKHIQTNTHTDKNPTGLLVSFNQIPKDPFLFHKPY